MFTTKPFLAACAASLVLPLDASAVEQDRVPPSNRQHGSVAIADEDTDSPLTVAASVDVTSRALWRGIPSTAGGAVVPTVTLSAWGFSATTTACLGFDSESPQLLEELDVGFTWGASAGDFRFDIAAYGYLFPGIDAFENHLEFVASAAWTGGPITIATLHGVESIAAPGSYYGDVSVTANVELLPVLGLSVSTAFGWANATYGADWYGVERAMPQSIGGNVSLSWNVGAGLEIAPHAGAWYATDERARDARETVVVWNTGVALAGSW